MKTLDTIAYLLCFVIIATLYLLLDASINESGAWEGQANRLQEELQSVNKEAQTNKGWAEHWDAVAHDLFEEWVWDACGHPDNADIHWDDMYFKCRGGASQPNYKFFTELDWEIHTKCNQTYGDLSLYCEQLNIR